MNNKFKALNEKLTEHQAATFRTSDLKLSEEGMNPASPSAQLVGRKHSDKAQVSSRTAFNSAHKPAAGNQQKHLGHLPSVKHLEAQAQAAAMKQKK